MTMIETNNRHHGFWAEEPSYETRFTAALAGGQEAVRTTVDFAPVYDTPEPASAAAQVNPNPEYDIPEPAFVPTRRTPDTSLNPYSAHMRAEENDHILGRE